MTANYIKTYPIYTYESTHLCAMNLDERDLLWRGYNQEGPWSVLWQILQKEKSFKSYSVANNVMEESILIFFRSIAC